MVHRKHKKRYILVIVPGSDYMVGTIWKRNRKYKVMINKKTRMVHVSFKLKKGERL